LALESPFYMIAGLHALYVLPHPFNYARSLIAQRHGRLGHVGYEIDFNRFFHRSSLALPREEIEADIRTIEQDIVRMLADIRGSIALMCEIVDNQREMSTI
jgi:hypothetical protein